MKIISVPHPVLRQISQPVTLEIKHLRRLLDDVGHTLMNNNIGVGLAAPQIGYSYRFLATKLPSEKNQPQLKYYLNPIIVAHSQEKTLRSRNDKNDDYEGCLSIPKVYAPVYRYTWLELTYQELSRGELIMKQTRLEGYPARVLQHELDHLDGILFTDRALADNLPLYYQSGKREDLQPLTQTEFAALFGKI